MNKNVGKIKILDYLKLRIYHFINLNKLLLLSDKNNQNNSHERRCTLIELALLYDIPIIVEDIRSQNMIFCKKEIYYKNKKEIKVLVADNKMIKQNNKFNYVIIDESINMTTLMTIIMSFSKKHIGYTYKIKGE